MTKDKYKYIENLFRNYKFYKSRIKLLEMGIVTDNDNIIGAIDYSKVRVQTSNKSDLSDIVINREEEIAILKYEVGIAETLLESLSNKDKYIIEAFYMESIRINKIAYKLNYKDNKSVWNNKDRIINTLVKLLKNIEIPTFFL